MTQDSVSVIIPAYHSARTIGECLDSVLAQTHPANQIIVIDDQSQDDTIDRIDDWNRNHNHRAEVRQLERNGGPAAARNAGLAMASSKWVAFLDADDAWLPWRLETQFGVLSRHPEIQFLCSETVDLASTPADGNGVPRAPAEPRQLTLRQLLVHNSVATSTVLALRDLILACGSFDTNFCGPEDYDLWLRVLAVAKGYLLPVPLSRYRTTIGSLSMDDRKFLPEVLRVLDKAFAHGGPLAGYRHLRYRTKAEQYTAASWMAYNRGDRKRALQLLLRSWLCGPSRLAKEQQDPWQRIKLLLRYVRPPTP